VRVTVCSVLDALEAHILCWPAQSANTAHNSDGQFLRFYACRGGLSNEPPDTPLRRRGLMSGKNAFNHQSAPLLERVTEAASFRAKRTGLENTNVIHISDLAQTDTHRFSLKPIQFVSQKRMFFTPLSPSKIPASPLGERERLG